MTPQQMKVLSFVKYLSGAGCLIGGALFILSLFASGYNGNYMMSITGATIFVSSMWVFGSALFCVLFEDFGSKKHYRAE